MKNVILKRSSLGIHYGFSGTRIYVCKLPCNRAPESSLASTENFVRRTGNIVRHIFRSGRRGRNVFTTPRRYFDLLRFPNTRSLFPLKFKNIGRNDQSSTNDHCCSTINPLHNS